MAVADHRHIDPAMVRPNETVFHRMRLGNALEMTGPALFQPFGADCQDVIEPRVEPVREPVADMSDDTGRQQCGTGDCGEGEDGSVFRRGSLETSCFVSAPPMRYS